MAVGCPVHYIRPVQNLAALRLGLNAIGASFSNDHTMLHAAVPVFRPSFEKEIKRLVGRDATELHFRPAPKALYRMEEKETSPDEPDVQSAASHTDVDGVQIYARSLKSFVHITNKLRPANNSHSVQMKEKAINPERTGFPGNTVKYVLERNLGGVTVPWIVEIQILMDGAQKYCKGSHHDMEFDRGYKRWLNEGRKGVSDPQVLMHTAVIAHTHEQSRPRVNEAMSRATGLDRIRQERTYYKIGDMPVAHVTDHNGADYCFVPDAKTGFFREDNSYMGKLNPDNRVTREDFVFESRLIVPMPDERNTGRANSPVPVSKIA